MEHKPGDRVRAFHPQMVGVVKEGTVEAVYHNCLMIDFGQLLGGIYSVKNDHVIVEETDGA